MLTTFDAQPPAEAESPLVSDTPLDVFGPPEVIEIEPIHNCNLRCIMCHVSYETMSRAKLTVAAIDQLEGLSGRWAKLGSLYEPAAHPEFDKICRRLTELGLKIDLTTNGALLTPRVIEAVKDCNFRIVTLSFDGARKETYERIRRGGDFEQALQRIAAFKQAIQARIPDAYFAVNYTVLRSNIPEIVDAVEMFEAMGFDHIGFIGMVMRSDAPILLPEAIEPVKEEMAAALDAAAELVVNKGYRITLSSPHYRSSMLRQRDPEGFSRDDGLVVSNHPGARTPFTPSTHFQNGPYPGMHVNCRSPFKFVRINYDGQVLLCQGVRIGNIYKQSLLDTWNGALAERMRMMVRESPEVCHDCEYFRFCIRANQIDYAEEENFHSRNSAVLIAPRGPFSIIRWRDRHYAVPHWVGAMQPPFLGVEDWGGVVVAGSEEDLYAAVDALPAPLFLKWRRHYRVYMWQKTIFGVPFGLRNYDFTRNGLVSEILVNDSMSEFEGRFGPTGRSRSFLLPALELLKVVLGRNRYAWLKQRFSKDNIQRLRAMARLEPLD